ncbi:MAG: hypothetical protein KKC05_03990, partial [Nanoarchaeota archaeon]|nr:hypothetical protein [Nanoarchaeota archaeon]
MASHRLFLLILIIIGVVITYGSISSNPIKEAPKTVDLIDVNEYNFEDKLEDILTQFHNLLNKKLDSTIEILQVAEEIGSIEDSVAESKADVNDVHNKISLLEDQGVITGNIIGFEDYENSITIYEQSLDKSIELTDMYQGYADYKANLIQLDTLTAEFEVQRDKLEEQLKPIEDDEPIKTLNVMMLLADKQID